MSALVRGAEAAVSVIDAAAANLAQAASRAADRARVHPASAHIPRNRQGRMSVALANALGPVGASGPPDPVPPVAVQAGNHYVYAPLPEGCKKDGTLKAVDCIFHSNAAGTALSGCLDGRLTLPSGVDFANAYGGYVLNLMSAGTGESNRIGRAVVIKKIELKLHIRSVAPAPAATGTVGPTTYRVVLVQDKNLGGTNGVTYTTVFASLNDSGAPADVDATVLPPNRDYRERFEVLMDRFGSVSRYNTGTAGEPANPHSYTATFNQTIDCNICCVWNGSSNWPQSNGLVLYYVCDHIDGNVPMKLQGYVRLYYDDQ